jgi:hypothetical protein
MSIGSPDRITVGVLLERASGERRVALIPPDIRKLIPKVTFVVESGAGREAGFEDSAYVEAGARIASSREILDSSDVVVKVRPPRLDEMPPAGRTLISLGGPTPTLASRCGSARLSISPWSACREQHAPREWMCCHRRRRSRGMHL